jgi:hypothetical protein
MSMDNKSINILIEDNELLESCTKLSNKITKYFEMALRRELERIKPKKISHEQVLRLICYALSMLNGDQINLLSLSIKRADVAVQMMDSINHVTQQIVYDFYNANKEEFQPRQDH